jgi:hypothetical protein
MTNSAAIKLVLVFIILAAAASVVYWFVIEDDSETTPSPGGGTTPSGSGTTPSGSGTTPSGGGFVNIPAPYFALRHTDTDKCLRYPSVTDTAAPSSQYYTYEICNATDDNQLYTYDSTNKHIKLKAMPTFCVRSLGTVGGNEVNGTNVQNHDCNTWGSMKWNQDGNEFKRFLEPYKYLAGDGSVVKWELGDGSGNRNNFKKVTSL